MTSINVLVSSCRKDEHATSTHFGEIELKSYRIPFIALAAALAITPAAIAGPVVTFDWTYGGSTDSVYAYGSLTATPDASIAGAYDILGGTGTRITTQGTFAVSIIGFGDPGPFPRSGGLGGTCVYSPSSSCDIHDAGVGGVTADLIFDNLLYANQAPGYQLDGDGFVLFEPTAPANDSDYYSVWGVGSPSQLGPSDQEFDPYTYNGDNLTNPFEVTLARNNNFTATPEPSSSLLLGTGLLGLAFVAFRSSRSARC